MYAGCIQTPQDNIQLVNDNISKGGVFKQTFPTTVTSKGQEIYAKLAMAAANALVHNTA